MFERILVPLDGSTRSEAALPIAARIAHAAGSSVVLLQVVSMPRSYGYGSDLGMGYGYGSSLGLDYEYGGGLYYNTLISEKVSKTERTEVTGYLTHLAHSDLFAGIATTIYVAFGQPASQILALAEQQAANLLVLCSHGRTGFLRWALGSVAQRVIHHSRVPVLVLREEGSTPSALQANTVRPFCVAVALDGSSLAETVLLPAAHLVATLAPHTQGAIHLLHVVKPHSSESETEEVEQAQAYLKRVREHLLTRTSDLNLLVTCSVTSAQDVAATIVAIAEKGKEGTAENGYDAIAMSTHGHGGIERWVMGSVTERVIGASTVPVLVVRPPQDVLLT